MEIDIEMEPFSDALRDAYRELLPEISHEKLDWRFVRNPAAGHGFATARAEGKIVGINAFMALRLRLNGALVPAYQSMDTVVAHICRGQGLFTRLLHCFYQAVPAAGAALLYGFPNSNSAHGFFHKLGWKRLGTPPFLIKPLRSGYFLKLLDVPLAFKRKLPPVRIVVIDRFDEKADALWQSHRFACAVERDAAYLNWRLADHPDARYTSKAALAADGSWDAFISYIALEKHGGRIGYVMEALARPGKEAALDALLRDMSNDMIGQRVDAILAWCPAHAPNHAAYRRRGFWPLPGKLRPIQLHFGYKPLLTGEQPVLSALDWYVSYLDSDTV